MYSLLEFKRQKRLTYPLMTQGEASPVIRSQTLLSEAFNGVSLWQVATSNRAIKCFKMTDPWPFKKAQGCGSVVGAGGMFCLEPEPPGHFWNIFPGAGVRVAQIFAGLTYIPGMPIWTRSTINMSEAESKSS